MSSRRPLALNVAVPTRRPSDLANDHKVQPTHTVVTGAGPIPLGERRGPGLPVVCHRRSPRPRALPNRTSCCRPAGPSLLGVCVGPCWSPGIQAMSSRNLDRGATRLTVLAERAGMTHQAMGELVDIIEAHGYVGPHQGLGQRPPGSDSSLWPLVRGGRIVRRDRLGGLLHEYSRSRLRS